MKMDPNSRANISLSNASKENSVSSSVLLQNAFQVLSDTDQGQNGVETSDVFLNSQDGQGSQGSQWSVVSNANTKKRKIRISDDNATTRTSLSSDDYRNLSVNDKLLVMYNKINVQNEFLSKIESKVDQCLSLHNKVDSIDLKMNEHEARLTLLEYKTIDLEARSRRKNLIFSGFVEERYEDCALTIKTFLSEKLQITQSVAIDRAHRLGRFRRGGNRGIIVAFQDFGDTQLILSKANKLKNTSYSINKDFPQEITNARKNLWAEYKTLKQQNLDKKVSLVYPAKIIVNGRVVRDAFPLWDTIMAGSRVNHSTNEIVDKSNKTYINAQHPVLVKDTTCQLLSDDRYEDLSQMIPDEPKSPQNSPTTARSSHRRSRSPRRRKSGSTSRGRPPSRHVSQPPSNGSQIRRPWDSNELKNTPDHSSVAQ